MGRRGQFEGMIETHCVEPHDLECLLYDPITDIRDEGKKVILSRLLTSPSGEILENQAGMSVQVTALDRFSTDISIQSFEELNEIIKDLVGIDIENMEGDSINCIEYLNRVWQKAKKYLREVLYIDIPDEVANSDITEKKDLVDIWEKTFSGRIERYRHDLYSKSRGKKSAEKKKEALMNVGFAPLYCALLKISRVILEVEKLQVGDFERLYDRVEADLFDPSYIEKISNGDEEKNTANLEICRTALDYSSFFSDERFDEIKDAGEVQFDYEGRAKLEERMLAKLLRKSYCNAEEILTDTLAFRIEVGSLEELEILIHFFCWKLSSRGAERLILENKNLLKPDEIDALRMEFDTKPPDKKISPLKITTEIGPNSSRSANLRLLNLTGSILIKQEKDLQRRRRKKKDEINEEHAMIRQRFFESITEQKRHGMRRSVEIQFVYKNHENEEGVNCHELYEAKQIMEMYSRIFGSCPSHYLKKIARVACEKNDAAGKKKISQDEMQKELELCAIKLENGRWIHRGYAEKMAGTGIFPPRMDKEIQQKLQPVTEGITL